MLHVKIELTYITPKGLKTTLTSDEVHAGTAILIADDLKSTGRTKNVTFIDSHENTWTLKELKKFMEEIQTEPHHVTFILMVDLI